jgi:hypothetical protein
VAGSARMPVSASPKSSCQGQRAGRWIVHWSAWVVRRRLQMRSRSRHSRRMEPTQRLCGRSLVVASSCPRGVRWILSSLPASSRNGRSVGAPRPGGALQSCPLRWEDGRSADRPFPSPPGWSSACLGLPMMLGGTPLLDEGCPYRPREGRLGGWAPPSLSRRASGMSWARPASRKWPLEDIRVASFEGKTYGGRAEPQTLEPGFEPGRVHAGSTRLGNETATHVADGGSTFERQPTRAMGASRCPELPMTSRWTTGFRTMPG